MNHALAMDEAQLINDAARGLLFPSESDHPFEAFEFTGDGQLLDLEHFLHQAGHSAGSPVETVDLDHFFRNAVAEQDWHEDDEKRAVRDFKRLVYILKTTLSDIKVIRVGKIEIHAYVVGKTKSGKWTGIKTKIVET